MKLTNTSTRQQRVLDAGVGRTVEPGEAADFSALTALELRRDFPGDWSTGAAEALPFGPALVHPFFPSTATKEPSNER